MDIIHYCCNSYDNGNYGGVARYDYHIKLIYPNRKFFKGPSQKNKMLKYLKLCKNPIIITDNHLSNDIPNKYPCILVHHGCARTTFNRNPNWEKFWKNLCTKGQDKMLKYRNKDKTLIISISEACTSDFIKYYKNDYLKFNRIKILHTSELNENIYKKKFNEKPIILGNWNHVKKGKNILPKLIKKSNDYIFEQLNVKIKNNNIKEFNIKKQNIYCKADIFLQLSNSEGNSYASLDALLCGLVVVSSNVGLFYKDVPTNCFVKIIWSKLNNIDYLKKKIDFAWKNRHTFSKNARLWYLNNYSFLNWKNTMINTINTFYNEQYIILPKNNNINENNKEITLTDKVINKNNKVIDEEITLIDKVINKNNKEITLTDQVINENNEVITLTNQIINENNQEITPIDQVINENNEEITPIDQVINENNEVITLTDQVINENNQEITPIDQVINENNEEITPIDQVINENNEEITLTDQVINENNQEITPIDQVINENNEEITLTDQVINENNEEITPIDQVINKNNNELNEGFKFILTDKVIDKINEKITLNNNIIDKKNKLTNEVIDENIIKLKEKEKKLREEKKKINNVNYELIEAEAISMVKNEYNNINSNEIIRIFKEDDEIKKYLNDFNNFQKEKDNNFENGN